jgi:hypothetical protein
VWTTSGQEHDNLGLIREAFALERDRIRERDGLLTGQQIEFALNELSLTKAAASELFGGGPNAFSKYVSGDVLQSFPMDRLLRLTLAVGAQALRYLRQGKDAPLQKNAAGYFVAPAVGSVTSTALASTRHVGGIQIMTAHPSAVETVQG